MKKSLVIPAVFLVLTFITGFINPAAAGEENAQKTICVLFDDGVDASLNDRQAQAQADLAKWMNNNLVRVFAHYAKAGFEGKFLQKRQDYKASSDNYLLVVKITDYNPGSKAARIVVGFGAGGSSIKIHYELFAGSNMILAKDDSAFSGSGWMAVARKLNKNTAKAVTEKLKNK
ncbi:MAG TPA: DUF4410 domain-containing protein [Candidatus Omnitrophota bacterium]|nr:DUF4410 domain-containing protein [Candidatus Omnitrophota bacterium]